MTPFLVLVVAVAPRDNKVNEGSLTVATQDTLPIAMKTTASSINRRLSREYPWEVGVGVYASPPLRWYVGGVSVGLNLNSGVFLHVRQSSPFMKIDSFKNLRKTNEKSLQNDSLLSQYVHSKQASRRTLFFRPPDFSR